MEEAITKNLEGAILKLASFLESLPKQMPVDDIASLNVTFVNGISLSNSSIGFEIDGLFSRRDQAWKYGFYRDLLFHREDLYSSRDQKRKLNLYEEHLQALSCRDSSEMIGISIDESVFHSASTLYFEVSTNLDSLKVFCLYFLFSFLTGANNENRVTFQPGAEIIT